MPITLHKKATTTPATRLALQQVTGTDRELAQQYGIGIGTVRKWRGHWQDAAAQLQRRRQPNECAARGTEPSIARLGMQPVFAGHQQRALAVA